MAYKLRCREVFSATVNGKDYVFTCYTQDTRYGFRHIATYGVNNTTECQSVKNDIVAKVSYSNRTWECFRYETVLRKAIQEVAPDQDTESKLKDVIIYGKTLEEEEKAEKFVNSFKDTFNSLTEDNKERVKGLADKLPNGMITNEAEAQAINGFASLLSLMQ